MARARTDTNNGKGTRAHGRPRPRRRYAVTLRGDTPLDLHDCIAAIHAAVIHALINTALNRSAD